MELMDYLTLEDAEDLYGIPVDRLIRYACNEHVSFAIQSFDLPICFFKRLWGSKVYNSNDLPFCGGSRFAYFYGNLIPAYEDSISSGVIPKLAISQFEKYPVGHPENRSSESMCILYHESELYRQWNDERIKDATTTVFLTRDAILNSKFMMSLLGVKAGTPAPKSKDKPVQNPKGKKEWKGKLVGENTYEKYEDYQLRVNKKYKENPHLNKTDVCNAVGSDLGVNPSTIYKVVDLKKSPKK